MVYARARGVGIGMLVALATVMLIVASRGFVLPAGGLASDFAPMTTFNAVACASPADCLGVGIDASSGSSGAAAPLDAVTGDLAVGTTVQLNWRDR